MQRPNSFFRHKSSPIATTRQKHVPRIKSGVPPPVGEQHTASPKVLILELLGKAGLNKLCQAVNSGLLVSAIRNDTYRRAPDDAQRKYT